MPDDLPAVYWDSCVFLSYINEMPDRTPDLDALLEQSTVDFQIVTSAITIVEVAFAATEKAARALDPEAERRISTLWTPESPIKLIEFHPHIAALSRGLVREAMARGWSLKPLDAIHLSTAQDVGATQFHTYDESLEKFAAILDFTIGPPKAAAPKLPMG